MARLKDREKALALRKEKQMSYSQIKKTLGISKSTLSYWLRDYPLSQQRISELRDWNEQRIEKCRETKHKKKEERLLKFYKEQRGRIFPLSKREFFLAGLFLYWGEGSKCSPTRLSISNTDPSIIKFFIAWLTRTCDVSKEKLRVHLHLYKDMDIQKEIQFWSKILDIPKKQFNKPYIKKGSTKRINHKGSFGHGTCNLQIGGARMSEKVLMAINAISDKSINLRA